MTLAVVTGGQYFPMTDAARLAQMIIGGVREEISIDRLITNSRSDIVREMRKAATDRVDDQETAGRLHRLFSSKKVTVNGMKNTAGIPSKEAEECYSKCSDMTDIQRQYKQNQTVSQTKPTSTDYQLEENKSVSMGQAKRIVQKAKNWDYSAEETNGGRKSSQCKWGSRCHDQTSYHRASYSHPPSDDHSTQRSDDTRSGSNHTRNKQLFSHVRDHNEKVECRYGFKCRDQSGSHRAEYSHPQNDEHSTRRSHDTRSDIHSTRGTEPFSHMRDHNEKPECRYSSKCRNQNEAHRAEYSHPQDDEHSTRRSDDTRSDINTTRSTQPFSHMRGHNEKPECRYSSKCRNQSEAHRAEYSHPQDDEHSTQRSHDTRSDIHSTRDRQPFSHVRDDNQKPECRHGGECYDQSDYHRKKYSHPTTRH